MIPVANITLEDALLDNPNFRANIKLFEGQVFFIESWLVALVLTHPFVRSHWQHARWYRMLSLSCLLSLFTLPFYHAATVDEPVHRRVEAYVMAI